MDDFFPCGWTGEVVSSLSKCVTFSCQWDRLCIPIMYEPEHCPPCSLLSSLQWNSPRLTWIRVFPITGSIVPPYLAMLVLVVVSCANGASPVACLHSNTGRTLHCAPLSLWKQDAYLIPTPKFTNCMSSIVVAATFVEKNSSSSFRALVCFSVFLHLVVRQLAAKWFDFKRLLRMLPFRSLL